MEQAPLPTRLAKGIKPDIDLTASSILSSTHKRHPGKPSWKPSASL